MAKLEELTIGASIRGLVPAERATVVQVKWFGGQTLEVTFRTDGGRTDSRILLRDDEPSLELEERGGPWSFDADPAHFRLAAEAKRIGLAALFDPLLAVHTSTVEPLPHQILAVYDRMVHRHPLRFLLADDPGAGKTIMAGLLIKELIARGDVERCLVVAPGSLVEQWQDELDQKFQLPFEIATNDKLEAARTGNWFAETPLAIGRLDKLSRDDELQERLRTTDWDLVIVDEAHKMSASYFGGEAKYTKRFHLGQLLSATTRHFLLMTATPHNGKEEDFQLFLTLLDGDRFEGRIRDAAHTADYSDLMRRMVKEQLRRFDGTKLFPERRATTIGYELSNAEATLYRNVSDYVREEFNRAETAQNGRRGTVGFALTILQRRLASSPEAIYQSLHRRRERLESRLRDAELMQRGGSAFLEKLRERRRELEKLDDLFDEEDEATAEELEQAEDVVADEATSAETISELRAEIAILQELEAQAAAVRRSGVDCKWDELSKLLQDTPEMHDASGNLRKIIIFTEHRDTLAYLERRIGSTLGRPEAIVTIHGGVGRDARRAAEERFRHDPDVQVLLATDAAGEGLNLQRAHLMVNYDLPWNPNRLEQRFGRIHRIGQTEVCHLWNLVASETREGDVFQRLLQKLEAQREALGEDGVFDVLGELFTGRTLRDLLIEAIRYGDLPETRAKLTEAIDNATEKERLRELIDRDALARDTMDARRIQQVREEMERAEARRLQPYYVQAWFEQAFEELGGRMVRREPGRFEVTRVPAAVRSRDRQIGRGAPVLPRYERVTFEKDRIRQGGAQAAFICPGHPLLDAVIDLTLERHGSLLRQGTVLLNPHDHGTDLKVLFILDHAIRDGTVRSNGQASVISRRLQFVLLDQDGNTADAGSAPYVDWQPLMPAQVNQLGDRLRPDWLTGPDLEQQAMRFAASKLVPDHLREVRRDRDALLDRTADAVRRRLLAEIQHWDNRANVLLDREQAGRTPRLNSQKAAQRAEDLQARLNRRLEEIERQRHLSPASPVIAGGALVVPAGLLASPEQDEDADLSPERRAEIDRLAVAAVMEAERRLGREPREMPHHNEGFDIESRDPSEPGRLRFIEVKGKAAGKATVTVSASQIRTCFNKPDDWTLAIVIIDGQTAREPKYLHAPFDQPPGFAEVGRNLKLADLLERGTPPQ